MVIDDLDFVRISFPPGEADTPAIIDSYAVLASAIAFECLEPIARNSGQIVEARGSM
jgi:hypothetical protein